MQHSGIVWPPSRHDSGVASLPRGSTGTPSDTSTFMQEDEQLLLQHLAAWRTVDTTAGRAVPYLFTTDRQVRPVSVASTYHWPSDISFPLRAEPSLP
jgi:hypothetical protein